jgi:hypothetical protein
MSVNKNVVSFFGQELISVSSVFKSARLVGNQVIGLARRNEMDNQKETERKGEGLTNLCKRMH